MGAIEVRVVGKHYRQIKERPTLVGSLVPFRRSERTDFWALSDVSFTVEPGETVGVLGRNGAGKTTLLRLLAGVTRPSAGSVTIRGRVAPLISVGVGFHQEMTGRENVFVNGMLLGLSRREVLERFDSIVAFSELEGHIDTPVKFYSSGMYMRLGFSVASHVDPDVLLVDEVLAVGDTAFQLKCFERMRTLRAEGSTIVLVSHSLHAIRLLCSRGILIRKGRLESDGTTEDAIARYHELVSSEVGSDAGHRDIEIMRRELLGPDGPTHHPRVDEPLVYRIACRFRRDVESPQVSFQVVGEDGTVVYEMVSVFGATGRLYREGDEAVFELSFVARLCGGTYHLRTALNDSLGRRTYAYDSGGYLLYIDPLAGVGGFADLRARIFVDGEVISDHGSLLLGPRPPDS